MQLGIEPDIHLPAGRRKLLIEMERIVGRAFYNAYTRNGFDCDEITDGRDIRYPLTFYSRSGRYKGKSVPDQITDNELLRGHYKCGANQLSIFTALEGILQLLEQNHGFRLKS